MGKRPVNSTKGGKFMNPTDQARKVARKKELKRNKKLRQTVRAAAIKSKSVRAEFRGRHLAEPCLLEILSLDILGRGEWSYLGHGKFGTKSHSFSLIRMCCFIFVVQLHLT